VLGKLSLTDSSLSCYTGGTVIIAVAAELHVAGDCLLLAATAQVSTVITVAGGSLSLHAAARLTVGTVVQTAGQTLIASNARLIAAVSLRGGLLLGFGECTGTVTQSAGRIIPGDSVAVGTLTLAALVQTSGALIEIHLRGLLSASNVVVLGNATLATHGVSVVSLGGFLPTLPILSLPVVVAARIAGATGASLLLSASSIVGCALTSTSTKVSLSILSGLFASVDESGGVTASAVTDEAASAAIFGVAPVLVFAALAATLMG